MQPLIHLKTALKVGDLSSTIAMAAPCFGALAQVRAIRHCLGGYGREFQRSKYIFPSHLKTYGEVWGNYGDLVAGQNTAGPKHEG